MEQMRISDSLIEIKDNTVIITNTHDYPVVVGSLGYLKDVSSEGTGSDGKDIAVIHTIGSYEDVEIFDDKKIKWFYFPPANTFCVGFYKITQS